MWPENVEALGLFLALRTQWRVASGVGGVIRVGLDYSAVGPTMRMLGLPRARAPELFDALQTMEAAFLKARAEARDG